MRMTVFGATGGIGSHVVRQALDCGFTVTAVVRDPSRLEVRHAALEVTSMSTLDDGDALAPVVRGNDAVLSGVGPRKRHVRWSTRWRTVRCNGRWYGRRSW